MTEDGARDAHHDVALHARRRAREALEGDGVAAQGGDEGRALIGGGGTVRHRGSQECESDEERGSLGRGAEDSGVRKGRGSR